MNETHDVRTALTKILAIVGFFAIVGMLVWLLVQGLRIVPGSFSSLASIAETIQNYQTGKELTIATEKTIVNSGDSFRVTWTDMGTSGSYDFRYTCIDGITLSVRSADNGDVPVQCSDTLTVGEDVHGLFVTIQSLDSRFIDVPFNVSFQDANGTTVSSDASITVVNATIPLPREEVATPEISPEISGAEAERTTQETVETTEAPKPVEPQAPATPSKPVVTEYTYTYYPVSDPKGFTDLAVKYMGIGTMSNDTFVPAGTFDNDLRGGMKFEVKNIGTKTSGDWTFTAVLPNGTTYTSDKQVALKPNERVEFTIGFSLEGVKAGTVTLKVSVTEKTDTKKDNNSFSWAAAVTN